MREHRWPDCQQMPPWCRTGTGPPLCLFEKNLGLKDVFVVVQTNRTTIRTQRLLAVNVRARDGKIDSDRENEWRMRGHRKEFVEHEKARQMIADQRGRSGRASVEFRLARRQRKDD